MEKLINFSNEELKKNLIDFIENQKSKNKTDIKFIELVLYEFDKLKNEIIEGNFDLYWIGKEEHIKKYENAINSYFSAGYSSFVESEKIEFSKLHGVVNKNFTPISTDEKILDYLFVKDTPYRSHEATSSRKSLPDWDDWTRLIDTTFDHDYYQYNFFKIKKIIPNSSIEYVCGIWVVADSFFAEKKFEIDVEKLLLNIIIVLSLPKHLAEIKKKSYRSAIAVIMARNQSHTDGSHLMVDFEKFISQKLDKSYIDKEAIKGLFKLYNDHLRNVMELVADVSGGIGSQSYYSYNLNDIYREYVRDYFSYVSIDSSKNIRVPSESPRFLGSGLTDGERDCFLELLHNKEKNDFDIEVKDFSCDALNLSIALPGGENGKTALLIFLKNLFRNLYKHSNITANVKSTFEENESKPAPKRHSVGIRVGESKNENLNDYYYTLEFVELSHSYTQAEAQSIVSKLAGHYESTIIDAYGETKKEAWGLMEMKICAAYLIGLPLEEHELLDSRSSNDFVIINGKHYPTQLVTVEMVKDDLTTFSGYKYDIPQGNYRIKQTIHLLKDQFATVWISEAEENKIEKEDWKKHSKELKKKAIRLKFESETNDIHDLSSFSSFVLSYPKDSTSTCGTGQKNYNFRYLYDCNFNFENSFLDDKGAISSDKIEVFKLKLLEDWNTAFFKTIEESGENVVQEIRAIDDNCKFSGEIENNSLAVFDDHNTYFKVKNDITLFGFYESMSNRCNTRKFFEPEANIEKNRNMLLEAINTRILILDERLQKYLNETEEYSFKKDNEEIKLTRAAACKLKGIFLPEYKDNSQIDLKNLFYPDTKNEEEAEESFVQLKNLISDSFSKTKSHYVLIHFSGFESVINRSPNYFSNIGDLKSKIDKAYSVLTDSIKGTGRYLIFTSGKGVPPNLPELCYYTPFNNIQSIIERGTKLDLVQLLNSVRITKTN